MLFMLNDVSNIGASMSIDPMTNKHKGFAFVEYEYVLFLRNIYDTNIVCFFVLKICTDFQSLQRLR
jgi:hypothetical protein